MVDHTPIIICQFSLVGLADACLSTGDVLVADVAESYVFCSILAGEEAPETAGPGFCHARLFFLDCWTIRLASRPFMDNLQSIKQSIGFFIGKTSR